MVELMFMVSTQSCCEFWFEIEEISDSFLFLFFNIHFFYFSIQFNLPLNLLFLFVVVFFPEPSDIINTDEFHEILSFKCF